MPRSDLELLTPPYDRLRLLEPSREAMRAASRLPGSAVVWHFDTQRFARTRSVLERRPGGLALVVILPDAARVHGDPAIVHAVQRCRPHGLVPSHEGVRPGDISEVLRRPPLDLPVEVTDYLHWRGLAVDRDTTHLLRRIIELSDELRSITALARGLYMSRRALGRRLMTRGLPVPSHWLQLGRILRVATRLQNSATSISSIAYAAGYPDGFSLSNQMQRLIGYRPTQVRDYLGWEWIMEAWLRREAEQGGLAPAPAMEVVDGERAPRIVPLPKPARGRPRSRRSKA